MASFTNDIANLKIDNASLKGMLRDSLAVEDQICEHLNGIAEKQFSAECPPDKTGKSGYDFSQHVCPATKDRPEKRFEQPCTAKPHQP